MADINLLFGVDGGGQINSKSGAAIAADIAAIVRQIEDTCTKKMEFAIDPECVSKMKSKIEEALKNINISIGEVSAKKGAIQSYFGSNKKSPENTLATYEQVDKVVSSIEKKIKSINSKSVSSNAITQVGDIKSQLTQLKDLESQGGAPEQIKESWDKLRESVNSTGVAIDKALELQEVGKNARYERLIALNKELYSLKNKQLTAGKNEHEILQKQVLSVEKKRNVERDYLTRNNLSDKNKDAEIEDIKKAYDETLKLAKAKKLDKEEAKAAADAVAESKRKEEQAARDIKAQEDLRDAQYKNLISLNKELYSLKTKQITAGKNESRILQTQIDSVQKRIDSETNILAQSNVPDANKEAEIKAIKDAYENTLDLAKAKELDKSKAKEAAASAVEAQKKEAQSYKELTSAINRKAAAETKMASSSSPSEIKTLQKIIANENTIISAKKTELKITEDSTDELSKKIKLLEEIKKLQVEASTAKNRDSEVSAALQVETINKRVSGLLGSQTKLKSSVISEIDNDGFEQLGREIISVKSDWEILKASIDTTKPIDIDKGNKLDATAQKISVLEERIRTYGATASAYNAVNNGITQNNKMLSEAISYYQKFSSEIARNKSLQQQWQTLINKLTLGEFTNNISQGRNELSNLKAVSQGLGVEFDNLTTKFRNLFSQHLDTAIVMAGVHMLKQGLKDIYESVKNVDTAMTELRKVTEESEDTYKSFMKTAEKMSVDIGATLSDTISSTADFARLGYSISDASQLAEAAIVYKNVGDGITDIEESTQSIISTMKAFGIEASGAMGIVDRFNAVGNNFAISSSGIGAALQRSAASLSAANNTIEESIALVTAANSVIQDEAVVGTALKTISMYLRAAKTEAEEAGVETEFMADSTSALRKELESLSGVDIMLPDGKSFKSTLQIIRELSAVWGELSETTQANITQKLAGKRQANVLMSLLTNFDTAEAVLETASNATGSALQENEKYLKSVEGAIVQLQATFETFSNNVLSSKLVVGGIDFLSSVLDSVNNLSNPLMAVATAITAIGASYAGLGFGSSGQTITLFGNELVSLKDKMSSTGVEMKGFRESIKGLGGSIKEFFTQNTLKKSIEKAQKSLNADMSALNSWQNSITENKLNNKPLPDYEKVMEGTSAAAHNVGLTLQNTTSEMTNFEAAQKASIAAAKKQLFSYKVAAAGAKILSTVLNTLTFVAVSYAIQGVSSLANTYQDAIEKAKDTSQKIEEMQSNLSSLGSKIEDVSEKYKELSKGVNIFGENIGLSTSEYSEYKDVVSQIAEISPDLITGYNDEGTALLKNVDIANALSEAYDKARESAQNYADVSINDIYKGYKAKTDTAGLFEYIGWMDETTGRKLEELLKFESQSKELLNAVDLSSQERKPIESKYFDYFSIGEGGKVNIVPSALTQAMSAAGLGVTEAASAVKDLETLSLKVKKFGDKATPEMLVELDNKRNEVEAIFSSIESQIEILKAEQENEDSVLIKNLQYKLFGLESYKDLSDYSKKMVGEIISNFDSEFLKSFETGDELAAYVNAVVVKAISEADKDGSVTDAYSKLFDLQTKYGNGEISSSEYIDEVSSFISLMGDLPEVTKKYIKIMFDVGDGEDGSGTSGIEKKIDEAIAQYSPRTKIKGLSSNEWGDALAESEKQELKDWMLSLNSEELSLAYGVVNSPEFGYSIDEWNAAITKVKEEAESGIVVPYSIANSEEQIDDFQDKISKYAEYLKDIENISSSEIIDIMQANPKFDWGAYGVTGEKGVGRLSDAIKTLATDAYVELRNALQAAGTSDELISVFEEIYRAATNATQSLEDLTASLTDYESNLSALAKAEEEQSKNGQLTTATYISLLKLGEDYSNCITIENGIIKLNTQAAKELTKAKLEEETATDRLTLSELSLQMARAGQAGDSGAVERIYKEIDETNKRIREKEAALANEGFDWQQYFSSDSDNSEDLIKDAFDSEYNKRKHWLYMGVDSLGNKYSEENLYTWLDGSDGYKKYFTDVEKYQDEIWGHEEAIRDYKIKALESEREEEQKSFNDRIEKYEELSNLALEVKPSPISETYEDVAKRYDNARKYLEAAVKKTQDRISELLSSGRDDVGEEINSLTSSLKEFKKNIEELSQSELEERVDKEQEYWENQKSLVEDAYDAKIAKLEEESDAIDKRNEKEEKQLALLEAEKKLKNDIENRNQLILKDGNIVYEADQDAVLSDLEDVESAKKALEDMEREEIINTLKSESENVQKIYDSILEMINLYKNGAPPSSSDSEILGEVLTKADTSGAEKSNTIDNAADVLSTALSFGKTISPEEVQSEVSKTLGVNQSEYLSLYNSLVKKDKSSIQTGSALPSVNEISKNMTSTQIQTKTVSVKFRDIAVSVQGGTSEEMINDFANKLGVKIDSIVQSRFSE